MSSNPGGIVEIVETFRDSRALTQDHIRELIQFLGIDPASAKYSVSMDGMVPPSTGEAMMSKRADQRERNLTFDALIGENQFSSRLAIYVPTEEDKERFATLPSEEEDEIGVESSTGLWLHDAAEVSKADCTLLISPVIVAVRDGDSTQYFHTEGFDLDDARQIIQTV